MMVDYDLFSYCSVDESINGVKAIDEVGKILDAGVAALYTLKKKTSFSLQKQKYFTKIKKRMKSYQQACSCHSFSQIVRWINNTFVSLNLNLFSEKQKSFALSVNNLLKNMKSTILSLYFFIYKKDFKEDNVIFNW